MELFDVYEEKPCLILTKDMQPVIIETIFIGSILSIFAACIVFYVQRTSEASTKPTAWFFFGLCVVSLYILCAVNLPKIIEGETWVIDTEQKTITCNGRIVCPLKDIKSLTISNGMDSEHGYVSSIQFQLWGLPPICLSQASGRRHWDEHLKIGRRIATLTDVRLIIDDKA
jgi:hypothetical protein